MRAYLRGRWPGAKVVEYLHKASGAKFNREGLDAMTAEVRKGRADIVAVYKLDRLGRSLQHLAQLLGEFESHGTVLIATTQGNRHERKQSHRPFANAHPGRGR